MQTDGNSEVFIGRFSYVRGKAYIIEKTLAYVQGCHGPRSTVSFERE